jgi:hypothetical protein
MAGGWGRSGPVGLGVDRYVGGSRSPCDKNTPRGIVSASPTRRRHSERGRPAGRSSRRSTRRPTACRSTPTSSSGPEPPATTVAARLHRAGARTTSSVVDPYPRTTSTSRSGPWSAAAWPPRPRQEDSQAAARAGHPQGGSAGSSDFGAKGVDPLRPYRPASTRAADHRLRPARHGPRHPARLAPASPASKRHVGQQRHVEQLPLRPRPPKTWELIQRTTTSGTADLHPCPPGPSSARAPRRRSPISPPTTGSREGVLQGHRHPPRPAHPRHVRHQASSPNILADIARNRLRHHRPPQLRAHRRRRSRTAPWRRIRDTWTTGVVDALARASR